MPLQILRRKQVVQITGIPLSTIYDLESKGRFPKRVRLSARASGWFLHEIEEWLKSRPRAAEAPIKMPNH